MIKIILMLLNVGLLFILLIYDFLLESWFIEIFKKELETANFIKCNFLYKYLLMNFYIDSDYFPDRVYKKDIKHYFERADVGDCSFVLSENERYSLDFSFDNILYKKDGQLSGHFYLQKKYEHLETHRFDGL